MWYKQQKFSLYGNVDIIKLLDIIKLTKVLEYVIYSFIIKDFLDKPNESKNSRHFV